VKEAKAKRRGIKQSNPPVEPRPPYLRHPQHLADQLLSKTRSNQMELFDGITRRLSPETRRKAIEYHVNVLGFDLTHAQQRGFEAALAILTREGYRSKKVRLTLDQWHADYGVEKKESARGWIEASQFTRLQSLNVLRELATIPWLIYYEKQVAPNRWQIVERIGPLWQLTIGYELSDEERKRFNAGDRNPELLDKLKAIEIEFNDVWLDQHENHYFWKPGNLLQQMFLALHGRRPPDHLNNFVTWILSEAEMKRRQSQPLELSATLDELANKCRLTGQMKHGNRTRVLATLKRNAEVAQKVNLITSFDFEDPQRLRLTCSPKVFAEAQEWAKRRQSNRPQIKNGKPSQPSARLYPGEIDRMLKDIDTEMDALRKRRDVAWDGVVRRELTAEEKSALEILTARRSALQEQKYGVSIPPAHVAQS
jgi:hypothetical protein